MKHKTKPHWKSILLVATTCLLSACVDTSASNAEANYDSPQEKSQTDSLLKEIASVAIEDANKTTASEKDAYTDGYYTGYDNGFNDADKHHSRNAGYDDSNEFYKQFDEQYRKGYKEGYNDGFTAGNADEQQPDTDN